MSEDLGIGVVGLQTVEQGLEGSLLGFCPGVGRLAFLIETALVTDTDTVLVVVLGMGSLYIFGTGGVEFAVLGDVVVVADTVKASCPVAGFQVFHKEVLVAARGAAVDDDHVDASHNI